MTHPLRYTSHLGFRSPELPLFPHAAGGLDAVAHVDLAHRLGFEGMLYPWALARPEEEVAAVQAALARRGMACGCVVYGSRELLNQPLWGEPGEAARAEILDHVRRGGAMARRLGSRTIAVLAATSPGRDPAAQRATMAAHLRAAGEAAAEFGVIVGIEPMIVLPDRLLTNCAQTREVIRAADHPNARIIFDTTHVAMMDGTDSVLRWFDDLYDDICTLQLADHPNRVEPGAGEIDMVGVLASAMRRGFDGLVELEHFWSEPGLAGEEAGLARVWATDAMARARVRWTEAVTAHG